MGIIIFNGVKSSDFGIQVSQPPAYATAKKKYRDIDVPGRHSVLHSDEGMYENIEREYDVSFLSNGDRANNSFPAVASAIAAWVGSTSGYVRLEDSYEPDFYRMARFIEELDITSLDHQAGTMKIKFDCWPQRFLKSGSVSIPLTSGDRVQNPTLFDAKPVIGLNAKNGASITVGDVTVSFSFEDETYKNIVIDCEMQTIYGDNQDLERFTTISEEKFPVLQNGDTTITFSENVRSAAIVPNWWTL